MLFLFQQHLSFIPFNIRSFARFYSFILSHSFTSSSCTHLYACISLSRSLSVWLCEYVGISSEEDHIKSGCGLFLDFSVVAFFVRYHHSSDGISGFFTFANRNRQEEHTYTPHVDKIACRAIIASHRIASQSKAIYRKKGAIETFF